MKPSNIAKHALSVLTAHNWLSLASPSAFGRKPAEKAKVLDDLQEALEFLRSIDVHRAEIRAVIELRRSE